MVRSFDFAANPKIIFGSGKIKLLPGLMERFGDTVLLITGEKSFLQSDHWDKLLLQFESARIHWNHYAIAGEPSPETVDDCVKKYRNSHVDVVVAIGGGSVMDGGKAVSAMLVQQGSVIDYLEGVGTKKPSGKKVPFIAVPTTAGTGSEATKNAVISKVGKNGFKKSLRHDNYVPDIALADPELTLSCPKEITAYSGMDAFTQLLESYVSTNANPVTDALAIQGVRKVRDGLERAVKNGNDLHARENMALAALLSGITLANAGLGTVHGFASSVGGMFDIPHGLVCARLMGPVNKLTIEKLRVSKDGTEGLYRYARIGKLFSENKNKTDEYYIDTLLNVIENWTTSLGLKGLSEYGIKKSDLPEIAAKTGNKYNPVPLSQDELTEALSMAL